MKFHEFVTKILLTIQLYEQKDEHPIMGSERRQIILKGIKKAINDEDIMLAYRLTYEKHVIIREISSTLFKVASQLLKMDCI